MTRYAHSRGVQEVVTSIAGRQEGRYLNALPEARASGEFTLRLAPTSLPLDTTFGIELPEHHLQRRPLHMLQAMGYAAYDTRIDLQRLLAAAPDGHLKFLHLWPGQIPPGQDGGIFVFSSLAAVREAKRVRPEASAGERWASHGPRRGRPQACPVGGWLVHGGRESQSAGALTARRWAASLSR